MKRRKQQEPEPPPEPAHVTEAKAAFEAAVPGVGVCERCGQPAKKRHRC